MNFKKILNSATMGHPERLRPMILWTILEYFFRGIPYGFAILVIWEVFKPLENPGATLNITNVIIACVGILVSVILLNWAARKAYIASYANGYSICADGRQDIAAHMRRLPMGFYNSRDPGDIGAYIVNDYTNIETLVTHLVPQFFGAVAMPLVLIACLFTFSWKLALIALLVIPFALPFTRLTRWIMGVVGKKHQQVKVNAQSRMIEYIQGIKLIKAFNLGGTKFDRLERSFRELKKMSIKVESVPAPTIIFASIILNAGMVLIMIVGFSMLLNVEISLPVYIMFVVLSIHIYQPLIHALTFMGEINYMELGVKRVEELRNAPLLSEGDPNEVFRNYDIEFRDVCFSYKNVNVINGVSLTIPQGKLTALVGPSGSGKTTLTRLIARFWDVTGGEILIGGKPLDAYTTDNLLQQISIVFQDVYLFNDTVYNNIRIGREDASREEIEEAAKIAHCHDFIMSLPDGYDTMVGEGGNTLSGGEKQRISIARAVLKNAPVVLLDEATASLDPENEQYIQQAINGLVKDKTVIVIAHRLNTISRADKIVVLNEGRIEEEGMHDELLSNGGLYRQLWDEQQRLKGWKFAK